VKQVTDIIKELRIDKDLKQSEIADFLKITQQQYSRYETGRNEVPLNVLKALADYHNVSTDFLLCRTKCTQSVDKLNKTVTANYSVGSLISDVLSLGASDRKSVEEFIRFHKTKNK
jgi:transcriptional regulator with XRE-family HTH domain